MSESPKLENKVGDYIEVASWSDATKKVRVKLNECNKCHKLFFFAGQDASGKWVKKNPDNTNHLDAFTPKERKPSETFRYIHWVKINEGVADQFEVSRTGNLGELDPIKTFGELKAIVARLPK